MTKNNHTTAICAGARHRLCCCSPWNCFQPRTPDALLARSSLKHQRKYKSEKGDKYCRSAQRNTVHSSLKRHKTDSLQSSVCDIGIVQITPVLVNGWRATKVCGLSPSSLGAQMDPLLWPKHKVLKYKYNIPVRSRVAGLGRGKNGHETFRQACIYNFRDKCVVFVRNLKFSNLTQ